MEVITLPQGWETGPLAEELRTYMAYQAELLQTTNGKFVLIRGSEIAGICDDQAAASNEGYRRYRLKGFPVRRVQTELDTYCLNGSAIRINQPPLIGEL